MSESVLSPPISKDPLTVDERKTLTANKNYATKRGLYLASPYLLGRDLLGYDGFCDTQLEWDAFIRAEINPKSLNNFKGLFLFPREVYKTTFYSITIPIWFLINNPNLTILICNEIYGNSISFLREIKGHLEKNEALIEYFGKFKGNKNWSTTEIIINQRTKNIKEPSIGTAGLGATTTSQHYDVVIMDDVAGPMDRDSAAKRKQTFNFFNDNWDVLKKEKSCFIMPGTRWHREDIYNHIINRLAPDLKRKGLGKFHVHVKPVRDKEGNLNYPNLLTEKKLAELRTLKMGQDGLDVSMYAAQYDLNPLDPATQIFNDFTFDNHLTFKYNRRIMWTDPAFTTNKDSDYSAVIVLSQIADGDMQGRFMVSFASISKRTPLNVIEDHNRIYRQFSDVQIVAYMETNSAQIFMKDMAVAKSAKDKGLTPVPTKGVVNTTNKEQRIRTLEPAITTGLIIFRKDWETAPEGYRLLVDQLRNFPQAKKDGPDALAGAYKQATKSVTSFRSLK